MGVEWNPYQTAVTTRRAAIDATIDRTNPDYWLPDTPLYPPGYNAQLAGWEVANLDNLAWINSKAREWGVEWNPYQDAVTTRRDAMEMLANTPPISGLTDQELANVLTQATAWGRSQTSSNQGTTPIGNTNLGTSFGTTIGSLPPLTSTNTTIGNVGPRPLTLSPPPPLTPQTITSRTEIVKEVQPDGSVKEVEKIIITATPAKDPYRELLPYGGKTGSEENFFRDYETAMSSPEERARALGVNPFAEVGLGDEYCNSDSIRVGNTSSPYLMARGVTELQLNPDRFTHILTEHSGAVPGKSVFSPSLLNPVSFARYVLEPILAANPGVPQGTSLVFEGTVPWAGKDANGLLSERVRVILMPARDGNPSAMEVLSAYPIPGRQ
jgi:hypothetical protein